MDNSHEQLKARKEEMMACQDLRARDVTSRERMLIYWLLRAYQSGHREGWEEGPSTDETMDGILNVLANLGYDPNLSEAAKKLLQEKPRFAA